MLFPEENYLINSNDEEYKRLTISYENTSNRFELGGKTNYSKQFAHIYASRLNETRELLKQKVKQKWGAKYPVKCLVDLREDNPEKCVLIGTLIKHQTLRPSVLREISEDNQLVPQPIRENFADESDILILEEESQRIRLTGLIEIPMIVTGVVCAIVGYEESHGTFAVEDYLFYESGPQKPLKELSNSPLLVLISGLNQSAQEDFSLSLDLFQQWLYGNLEGYGQNKDYEAASVVRVVVAGNSVRQTIEPSHLTLNEPPKESKDTIRAIQQVDDLVSGWMKSVHVDLMPGEFDPSNFMLPQQPIHQCILPKCAQSKSFNSVTNPYEFTIEGRYILGTSGQNINNIQKYSKITDPLKALESVMMWSHLTPTSPDTLPCYPYYDSDPFIIKNCPHILFAGNADDYHTKLHIGSDGKKIRLVCIPSFAKTQSVAVVNLRTLDCQRLNFSLNGLNQIEE